MEGVTLRGLSPATIDAGGLDTLSSIKITDVRVTYGIDCIINEFTKELKKP